MSCRCWRPVRPRTPRLPRGCGAVGREGEVWQAARGPERPDTLGLGSMWGLVGEAGSVISPVQGTRVGHGYAELESRTSDLLTKLFRTLFLFFFLNGFRAGMRRLGRDENGLVTRAGKTSFDLNFVWSPAKSHLAEKLTLVCRLT